MFKYVEKRMPNVLTSCLSPEMVYKWKIWSELVPFGLLVEVQQSVFYFVFFPKWSKQQLVKRLIDFISDEQILFSLPKLNLFMNNKEEEKKTVKSLVFDGYSKILSGELDHVLAKENPFLERNF